MSVLEETVDVLADALDALEAAVARRIAEVPASGVDDDVRDAAAEALSEASDALTDAISALDDALAPADRAEG